MADILQGIDVSSHNGDINWRQVGLANNGHFVFIKATEGQTWEDPRLTKGRVEEAEQFLGRPFVGYYHFARPDNNPARDEARHFVRFVRSKGGRIGRNGVLDYEVAHPGEKDEAWIKAWVDEYRKLTGERPIIYGGSVLREEVEGTSRMVTVGPNAQNRTDEPLTIPMYGILGEVIEKRWQGGSGRRDSGNAGDDFGCPLWLAAYVADPERFIPEPWRSGEHRMRCWQYTDRGTCSGVSGLVDVNKFFGKRSSLRDFMSG